MLCGWVTKPGIPALTGGEQTGPPGSVSHQLFPSGFCQQINLTVGRTGQVQGKGAVSSQPPLLPGFSLHPAPHTRSPQSIWLLWSQTELQAEGEWEAGSRHREGRARSSESISQCIWRQQPSSPAPRRGIREPCRFVASVGLKCHSGCMNVLSLGSYLQRSSETGANSLRGRGIWGEMCATPQLGHFICTLSVFPV